MNNAIKGALWSGLVFPGLGQVVLKRYKRGAVIIVAALAGLSVAVVIAVQEALAIVDRILAEGGPVGMDAITAAAAQASNPSGSRLFNLCLILVLLCWIFGTLDAYRIGRQMDAGR